MKNSIILSLVIPFLFLGCKTTPEKGAPGERVIFMNYTDWAESIALTKLTAVLLEDHLGYEVNLRLTVVDTVFRDLANGEADVFVDVWTPQTHQYFLDKYGEHLEDLGTNYSKARTGLVVPGYMDAESIEDLEGFYSQPVIGVDTTSGIMKSTMKAFSEYGLQNELKSLSDPKMAAKLENAIRRRENIVVTGWEPHWLFYRYDLKFLKDPLEVYLKEESIHTFSRKGFSDEHPTATTFFERMVFSEEQINELLYEIHRSSDPLEGVKTWIEKNQFIVNQWVKGLSPQREKIM